MKLLKFGTAALIVFSVTLCAYAGIFIHFSSQSPTRAPAPFTACLDNCTMNLEYRVSKTYQRTMVKNTLNQIFTSYVEADVGYYLYCNDKSCRLWVYVNTPSKLEPILHRLENEVSPILDNESLYHIDNEANLNYSLYTYTQKRPINAP